MMGWLNSDDKCTPWALRIVGEIFGSFPEIEWLTTLVPIIWDVRGLAVRSGSVQGFSRQGFWRGEHLPKASLYTTCMVQQELTLWRRLLWETGAGAIDTSGKLGG